jgi:hypothetical protein
MKEVRTTGLSTPQERLWMPPHRIRRYQWQKVVAAALVGAIFAGWLVIRWSSVPQRVFCFGLLAVTLWVLLRSVISDGARARTRQLGVCEQGAGVLRITGPTGTLHIGVQEVSEARWLDEPEDRAGLWLYDREQRPVAHLDRGYLSDQREACAFLGWARRSIDLKFPVIWPQTDLS